MSFPPPPNQEPQQPPEWSPPPAEQQYRPWPDPVWGAPPPRKSRTGLIVTLSVVGGLVGLLLIVGVIAATLGSLSHPSAERRSPAAAPPAEAPTDPAEAESSAEADVKLSACEIDSLTQWPSVVVTITNRTAGPMSYIVSVEFVDRSGTRVAEGIASTSALAPGRTSKQKAQGVGEVPAGTKCRVSDVSRFPDAG
ncbi:FxLYD domain-containing protein [Streptomyces sp. NPDC086010]|uniref:FxLYD domain-containing protein n=1 Tax=Streptomyces sp. NPDC086010 TaxID=3365745 RepID=UPI0037D619BA